MAAPEDTRRRLPRRRLALITVVIVLTILAVIAAAFILGQKRSSITVTLMDSRLHGPQPLDDAYYRLYVDGALKREGTLPNDELILEVVDVSWLLFACHDTLVAAQSWWESGPGIYDSRSIVLCEGGTATVLLQI